MKRETPNTPTRAEQLQPDATLEAKPSADSAVSALIVSGRALLQKRLSETLEDLGTKIDHVANPAQALAWEERVDLVVVDAACGEAIKTLATLGRRQPGLVSVLVGGNPSIDDAVRAMQAGASDIIPESVKGRDLSDRLGSAVKRAGRERARDHRVARLKKLCHHLNDARQEVSGHVGGLCNDLVEAFRDLSDQMSDVTVASELQSLLRQELEIESLLRTMLEFLLAKIGSTNAAVFLPSSSGDYSLGAYINYDCPRDSAEIMLDQLADTLAPRFEDTERVLLLDSPEQQASWLGQDADWFADSTLMVASCRQSDECLGVLALFRDSSKPFSELDLRLISLASDLFAAQLERVIHVHHRHLPKSEWGAFDPEGGFDDNYDDGFDDGFDDFDDGFGDIDMAA